MTDVASGEVAYAQAYMDSTDINQTYFSNAVNELTGSSIDAGESAKLKVTFSTVSNSVGNNNTAQCVNRPVVILALPSGFSYSDLKFTYSKGTGMSGNTEAKAEMTDKILTKEDYLVENISYMNQYTDTTPADNSDDWKEKATLYKITFKDNIHIGHFDSYGNLGLLRMDITLGTDVNMISTNYKYSDMIQIMSEKGTAAFNTTTSGASSSVSDCYGVNDGKTLGRVDPDANRGIKVNGKSTVLVSNAICVTKLDGEEIAPEKQEWMSYDESNPNSTTFLGMNSAGKYRVTLNNPSPSAANKLKLLVPLIQDGTTLGSYFQKKTSGFDMHLSWNESQEIPAGFTLQYIKIDTSSNPFDIAQLDYSTMYSALYDAAGDAKYEVISSERKDEANAVLVETDDVHNATMEAGRSVDFVFDFTIGNGSSATDVTNGDVNLWRNGLIYQSASKPMCFEGNYVRTEIATSVVNGFVFEDKNNDGLYNGNDIGVPDILVTLRDSVGRVQTATTDSDGNYKVTQVRNDTVNITMKLTSGVSYRFRMKAMSNIASGAIGNQVMPATDGKSASTVVVNNTLLATVNAAVSNVCNVSYHANGAGNGSVPLTKAYQNGDTVTVERKPSALLKTGYSFLGWSLKENPSVDDVDYVAGDTFVVTKDVTLYAVWKVNTYQITFDYQGGSITEPVSKTVVYGGKFGDTYAGDTNPFTWFESNPTKSSYMFWRWELADVDTAVGSGTEVKASTKVSITKDMIVRPVFVKMNQKEEHLSLTVGDTSAVGEPFIDLTDVFEVENMMEGGTLKFVLAEGATLPQGMLLDANGKLYGTPTAVTNGETEVALSVEIYNASSSKCYTLSGEDGITLKIAVSAIPLEFEFTTNPKLGLVYDGSNLQKVTLQTVLSGINESVAVTSGGSDSKVNFYIKKDAEAETLLASELAGAIDGNQLTTNFAWKPSQTGSYTLRAEFVNLSDCYSGDVEKTISFTVSAAPIVSHEISFVTGVDSLIAPDNITVVDQTAYGTVTLPVLQRDGYEFLGWFQNMENGDQYTSEEPITENITLYAHWRKYGYTVKYDLGGAQGEIPDKQDVSYNQSNLLPTEDLTYYGYDFKQWVVKDTNQTVTSSMGYHSLVSSDQVSSVTLVAQWTPKESKILYDYGDGNGYVLTKKVTYHTAVGELATGTRLGYVFSGWKQEVNAGGVSSQRQVTENTICDWEEQVVLMAQWTAKKYEVQYLLNGGTCGAEDTVESKKDVTWNSAALLPDVTLKKTGYIFEGWKCGEMDVTDSDTYGDIAGNDSVNKIVLQAQWREVSSQGLQVCIMAPVYHSQDATTITIKGTVVQGDYEIRSQTFRYRKLGAEKWTDILDIGNYVMLDGLLADTVYEVQLSATDSENITATDQLKFKTQEEERAEGQVEGYVTGDVNKTFDVTVENGNTIIASMLDLQDMDNFAFTHLPDGVYNLVVTDGSHKVTKFISIIAPNRVNVGEVAIGRKQTKVEIGDSGVDVAVGGLNDFYETALYKNNDSANAAVDGGGTVEVRFKSEAVTQEEVLKGFEDRAKERGCQLSTIAELNLQLEVSPKGEEKRVSSIPESDHLLLIAIPLAVDSVSKEEYQMYRIHNHIMEDIPVLSQDEMENPSREGFCVQGAYAYVWAKRFSAYALAYGESVITPTPTPVPEEASPTPPAPGETPGEMSPTPDATEETPGEVSPTPEVSEEAPGEISPSPDVSEETPGQVSPTPNIITSAPLETPSIMSGTPSPTPAFTSGHSLLSKVEQQIVSSNTDKGDIAGSVFAPLYLRASGGKKQVKLSWKKIKGATGYIVYGGICGKKMTKLVTVKGASKCKSTLKKLKKGKYYKYIVVAYQTINGNDIVLSTSKSVHIVTNGGKRGNPVKVKVKKIKVTLKKGKSAKIKASIKQKKKITVHIAKLRYESSNAKIVTVNKKGKVSARKKGNASVYVYSQNGLYKKVKVKVR